MSEWYKAVLNKEAGSALLHASIVRLCAIILTNRKSVRVFSVQTGMMDKGDFLFVTMSKNGEVLEFDEHVLTSMKLESYVALLLA